MSSFNDESDDLSDAENLSPQRIRSSWEQATLEAADWLRPKQAMHAAELAHNTIEQCPNSRVFSLGQSPAWIVKAIQKEAALKGMQYETGYIPFSGSFFEREMHVQNMHIYRPKTKRADLGMSIKEYRKVLTALGLSPQTIIDHFQKDRTRTTISEFFIKGRGLASFLYVLRSWAKENKQDTLLQKALDVRLYSSECAYLKQSQATINLPGFAPTSCNFHAVDRYLEAELMISPDKTRIVPHYSWHDWHKKPGQAEGEEAVIKNTNQVLHEAVVINNLAPDLYDDWAKNGRVVVDRI